MNPAPDWRPDYGGLRHDFKFDPLHYGVDGERRREFKRLVRAETELYGFVLTGEVTVRWDLFIGEQERWESDTGADVDNYAKLLNDAITGSQGLLVDDMQIQRLEVAWLPALVVPSFGLSIDCRPDEWSTRPLSMYEVFGGLWHPLADVGIDSPEALALTLYDLDDRARREFRVRHHLRALGCTRRQAFDATRVLGSLSYGFHTTRARASGFPLVGRTDWSAQLSRPHEYSPETEDRYRSLAEGLKKWLDPQ